MVLSVGAENFLGLATMGTWNSITSVGSRVDMPVGPGGMEQDRPLVKSSIARTFAPVYPRYGQTMVKGEVSAPWFAEGFGKLFDTALIRTTSAGTNFNTHTWALPTSGTFQNDLGVAMYENRSLKLWRTLSAFLQTATWTFGTEPFVEFKAGLIGASRTLETAVTNPSFGSLTPMTPFGDGSTTGLIISGTINGNAYTDIYASAATLTINTGVDLKKSVMRSAPVKPERTGKVGVSGSFTWSYSSNSGSPSADWLAAWDAGTPVTNLTFTLLGDVIASSSPSTRYTLQIVIPTAYPTGKDPVVGGPGPLEQTFPFEFGIATPGGSTPTVVIKSAEALP